MSSRCFSCDSMVCCQALAHARLTSVNQIDNEAGRGLFDEVVVTTEEFRRLVVWIDDEAIELVTTACGFFRSLSYQ